METKPVEEPNPTVNKPNKSHSVVGCLSAVFGAFALAGAIYFTYLMKSDLTGDGLNMLGGLSLGATILCSLPAIILGIIGITLKNRKKLFPIIGLSIVGVFIALIIIALLYILINSNAVFKSGRLPLKDTFTYENWKHGNHVDYFEDTLRFTVTGTGHRYMSRPFVIDSETAYSYKNVHIEVTAITNDTDSKTSFGIICNLYPSVRDEGYFLGITPEGKYAIARIQYNEQDIVLTNNGAWASSDLISQNANSYRIGVDCYNGNLTLYVDGKLIDSVADSSYLEGGFGLRVISGNESQSIVRFDDFQIRKKR